MTRISTICTFLAALAIGAITLSGCGAQQDPPKVATEPQSQEIVVDADTLDALDPGEHYVADLRLDVVYLFDFSQRALDFTRIDLIAADGTKMPMSTWLTNYRSATGDDLTASPLHMIRMGALESTKSFEAYYDCWTRCSNHPPAWTSCKSVPRRTGHCDIDADTFCARQPNGGYSYHKTGC